MSRAQRRQQQQQFQDNERPDRSGRTRGEKAGFGGYIKAVPSAIDNLKPQTAKQALLLESVRQNVLTFATGPAGVGKSHCPLMYAARLLRDKKIEQIILTNPCYEIGKPLGIEPGYKDEKLAGFYKPMITVMVKAFGPSGYEMYIKDGKIVLEPLSKILGATFDDTFLFIDEAQNTTPQQMKALLTRVGKNTTVVVSGDYAEQQYTRGESGIVDAFTKLKHLDCVGHIEFDVCDIVRSDFCRQVVEAYRKEA